jgi:hypothetical protein
MHKELTTMMMNSGVCMSVWVSIVQNPMSMEKARNST